MFSDIKIQPDGLRQGKGKRECLTDRIHPIFSGALASTRWEPDLGLAVDACICKAAVMCSAPPSAPGQLAVLELLRARWAVGLLVTAEKPLILVPRDCCCFGASLLL